MSPHQLFIKGVATILNALGTDKPDITCEQLARGYCSRKYVGDGMPEEIAESHNDIIRFAHEEMGERDWLPTTKIYFSERLFDKEIVDSDDRDIIRALCLGYGKPCHGFRMARGVHDFYLERWTNHYHNVRSGVEKAADKKTLRAAINAHLPNKVAAKMIVDARTKGLNHTDYPAFFHFHKTNDPAMKCNWTAPGALWTGDKSLAALLFPAMDRVRVNLMIFESEFRYMTEKKFKGIDPAVTLRIVRIMYGRLIYALFQKSPGKASLTKTEVFTAAKEIDIDAEIYKAMAGYQKPPTNLLEDE